MKQTTFTPGAWRYDAEDGTIRADSSQLKNSALMGDYRGPIIADIAYSVNQRDQWPTMSRFHALPEAEANAQLVAAAPDLLVALTAALDSMVNQKPLGTREIVLKQIRAAIAKATS